MLNCLENEASQTNIVKFRELVNQRYNLFLSNYQDLLDWSIEHKDSFWSLMWDYAEIIGDKGATPFADAEHMIDAQFFPDGSLNFAENLLRRRDDAMALIFSGENRVCSRLSYASLYREVSLLHQALKRDGIKAGDHVCAYLPNMPDALIAMLAVASIGAIWSSCSPDFSVKSAVDRFGQIEPKLLITVDGYFYAGKAIENFSKLESIVDQLPSLKRVLVVPYMRRGIKKAPTLNGINKAILLSDYVDSFIAQNIEFERFPFNHPLYIMFSNDTDCAPKCSVHGAGGTLIQHLKEHQLHSDIRENDRVFYLTSCAGVMWNWLVSSLASKASIVLYDGFAFHGNDKVLFTLAEKEQVTHFGAPVKFIDTLRSKEVDLKSSHNLSKVRVLSTMGAPLFAENCDYVYDNISHDLTVTPTLARTDIMSCFLLGNPSEALSRGEVVSAGLGMAVEIWSDDGKVVFQEKGQLVCTEAFPSMPLFFWNDIGHEKYKRAHFEKNDRVWGQSDFVEMTKSHGFVSYGCSDTALNSDGVKIGTAEIYHQVGLMLEVSESVVIAQQWNNATRIVLFVILNKGVRLSANLKLEIKRHICEGASSKHVPSIIVAVSDIPRYYSGKVSELAVKNVVAGKEIKNRGSLANPESLSLFENIRELIHS